MLYRLHFATDEREPMPPPADLVAIEADDPVAAVEAALARGLVPQDRVYAWARVVLALHADGSARQVLRVPITPERSIPVEWRPPA